MGLKRYRTKNSFASRVTFDGQQNFRGNQSGAMQFKSVGVMGTGRMEQGNADWLVVKPAYPPPPGT